MDYIRQEYWKRGFQEVISPNIYNAKLWQTSGHWDHYAENMFRFEVEKEKFGLKPMNCPGKNFCTKQFLLTTFLISLETTARKIRKFAKNLQNPSLIENCVNAIIK